MSVVTFLLLVGAFVGLSLLMRRLARYALTRPDPALHIRPPRRYVDADGNSDFRGDRCVAFLQRDPLPAPDLFEARMDLKARRP